jgi:hypothetical protein
MFSSKLKCGSAAAFAAAGVMFLTVAAANAAMAPVLRGGYSASDIQLTSGGCGPGWRRTVIGYRCVRNVPPMRYCQPGFHSQTFPNGQGYRCVMNH